MNDFNDVKILIQRIVENVKPGSTAHEWAMQLAGVMNRTDPCERCGGSGCHRKHRNCHHGSYEAMLRDCYEKVECKKCQGSGRVMKKIETERSRKENP